METTVLETIFRFTVLVYLWIIAWRLGIISDELKKNKKKKYMEEYIEKL